MATADAADMAFKHGRRIVEHGDAHTPVEHHAVTAVAGESIGGDCHAFMTGARDL
jgi:hypothetical protein